MEPFFHEELPLPLGRGKGLVMEEKLELSESFTLNSITSLAVLP